MIRLLLLLCLLAAPTAQAQFSGTVRGTVRTLDTRADPYAQAGYGFANAAANANPNRQHFRQPGRFNNTLITVPEALVEVCVILVATVGCKPLWTRTNHAGEYAVEWWGLTSPVAIVSKVYAIRPLIGSGIEDVVNDDDMPPHEFRITTAGFENVNVGEKWRFSATASLGNTRILDIMVADAGREVMNAYLTARETYAMLSSQTTPAGGGTIRSDTPRAGSTRSFARTPIVEATRLALDSSTSRSEIGATGNQTFATSIPSPARSCVLRLRRAWSLRESGHLQMTGRP